MAGAKSRVPRIRMPRVTLPTRRGSGRATAATKPLRAAKADNGEAAATKEAPTREAAKPQGAAAEEPTAAKAAATRGKPPTPNMQERIEGLQGWMAEIERRQGRITYFGAVAVLVAVLAAGAALYFALTAKSDSATKSDLDEVSAKVEGLRQAVTKNTKDTQDTINNSISQLQQSISDLQKKQAQDAANISTLQSQAASGAFAPKGAVGATPPAVTPGATTTTTPKKP